MKNQLEYIHCPYCAADSAFPWASENGFTAVKCKVCRFIYVNPRPVVQIVNRAVETGYHAELSDNKSAVARRVPRKIQHYRRLLKDLFSDIWVTRKPVT